MDRYFRGEDYSRVFIDVEDGYVGLRGDEVEYLGYSFRVYVVFKDDVMDVSSV